MKGVGNSLNFGERIYDSRLGQFPTPDPLAAKFPSQSPYTFAGDNPIWNIDKKGLKKETFNITINQQTGKTTVNMTTSTGLMAKSYTSMHSGIRTYDWYDYTVANVTVIDNDGNSSRQSYTFTDKFRTNTLFKSESYAQQKIGEKDWFDFSTKEKNLGKGGGITLTTSNPLYKGNDHNLNRNGRGEFVNADGIASAFGVSAFASGAGRGTSIGDAIKYLRDGILAANDAQGLAPINLKGNDTSNCDVPGGCGQLHVTDRDGNKQVGVSIPEGKTKDDY